MIERVEIEQFQNHEKTVLDFSPGLNVICGPSKNGKSALIRAIGLVLTNKPSGYGFKKIDNCGLDTRVLLKFTDGEVTRIRGAKKNLYIFNGEEYKAVRSDVPEEILEFINIGEQNIQTQFASHYLVSESPGEVARKLNSLVGLEDIDKANKKVGRIIADSNSHVKFLTSELEKHESRMKKYDELNVLNEQLIGIERIVDGIQKLESEIEVLENVTSDILQTMEECLPLEKIIQHEEKVDSVLDVSKTVLLLTDELHVLQQCIREILVGNTVLENGVKILLEEDTIDSLIEKFTNLEETEELEEMIQTVRQTDERISVQQNAVDSLVGEYTKAMKNQKVCPLCERSM